MITDTELRIEGMNVLLNALGEVQAEGCITLIIREPFDYTKWQRTLHLALSTPTLTPHK